MNGRTDMSISEERYIRVWSPGSPGWDSGAEDEDDDSMDQPEFAFIVVHCRGRGKPLRVTPGVMQG